MNKVKLPPNVFIYPMPVTLVGTTIDERDNFLAVSWVTRVNVQPPMIAVAIGKNHESTRGIQRNKAFSLSIPNRNMMPETDYCGLVSGKKTDKSKVFKTFRGILKGAPLIESAPLTMECEVIRTVELPANNLFIAEIVGAWTDPACLKDGVPDPETIQPFVLTMPDNNYWALGERIGKAWDVGRGRMHE